MRRRNARLRVAEALARVADALVNAVNETPGAAWIAVWDASDGLHLLAVPEARGLAAALGEARQGARMGLLFALQPDGPPVLVWNRASE